MSLAVLSFTNSLCRPRSSMLPKESVCVQRAIFPIMCGLLSGLPTWGGGGQNGGSPSRNDVSVALMSLERRECDTHVVTRRRGGAYRGVSWAWSRP
jgi:hypothetical protein